MFLLLFAFLLTGPAEAQSTFCTTSAIPPVLRAEGLAERVGDVELFCTGAPNVQFTANFTFILSLPVTNRLSATNTLTGIVLTVDSGSGPQPTLVQPILANQFSVAFDGVSVVFSPRGTANINVAGIRVNASQVQVQTPITEYVSINAASFPITTPQSVVGTTERGLYASNVDTLVCAQNGSPLPASITFSNLLAANTSFASTRVTEGFGDAFGPKSASDYFMADSGQRIIVTYGGFPYDAQLFVPDRVAGSDATTPTAGGDFELPASGGAYTPSPSGSLLLARVVGAASNGAGGTPIYMPDVIGSGTVTFDTVSQIPITNGTAYVVYEVVDANPSSIETAQFPTFLGLAPDGSRNPSTTSTSVLFAPQSKVATVSATEPLPRFDAITPLPDCTILDDCSFVQSSLTVDTTPLQFTETQGGVTGQLYFTIGNNGHGLMNWTATISYPGTPGWLTLDPASGVNGTTVRAYATPGDLPPSTYQATININAGAAGSAAIGVTFTITPPAPKPTPTITSALNSASMLPVPVVPGSLTTINGTLLSGNNVIASFNDLPATILTNTSTQIELVVPPGVSVGTAQLIINVDGSVSPPFTVQVAGFEPAIFPGAVLNQDGSGNSATNAAARNSTEFLIVTGLSGTGTISVLIGTLNVTSLNYAGPAAGWPGVQLVSFTVPSSLPSGTANLYVCGSSDGVTQTCSQPVTFTVQ